MDTDTKEEFIIDSIQTCKLEGDNGPNTMVYKLFPDNQYTTPSHPRDYEYTRVDEIKFANYVTWIPRGESKLAAAILSDSPRDFNRSTNHSLNGKPLKLGSAIKSPDRE